MALNSAGDANHERKQFNAPFSTLLNNETILKVPINASPSCAGITV
jgi:hypothetical protein